MIKLLATCDRILARLPVAEGDMKMIGGIIIPESAKLKDRKPIVELVIESAGPDCKVAKGGMKVVVNKNVCSPIEYNGVEWMIFSEVTAIAIIKEEADPEPTKTAGAPLPATKLTIEEVRAGIGIKTGPVNDSSDLPVAPPPVAP